MKNNSSVLLKTLLKSTSIINILKTSKDKKKRGRIIGGIIGAIIIYLMLGAYCVLTAIGYAKFGLSDKMAGMTAIIITLIAFVFTLIKTNSYLFDFKEYDMLMALPFKVKTVVGCKFLYMYVKSLPWYLSISITMLIGYGITGAPAWYVYPLWILLSLPVSMIPMLLASLLGFLLARISTGFKHWKAVQAILLFAVISLSLFSRFFFEKLAKEAELSDIVGSAVDATTSIGKYYFPVAWFETGVTKFSISSILLLIGVTLLLFEAVFFIYARSYKKVNSTMKTSAAKKNFKLKEQKKKSAARAMAFKELKRFFGSVNWLVNAGFGYIAAVLIGVASLFVGFDKIIGAITEGAPISGDMVLPAIPFVAYLMTGMVALTASSPSLEGKNYWIIKSLPLSDKDIYGGKILANLYISIPSQLIATLCMCIAAKAGVGETIGYMILGVVLCLFSATFGCACGIHFMRLDWENEIEIIKQGASLVVYMFPNLILTMGALVGSVILAMTVGKPIVITAEVLIYSILIYIFYLRTKALAKRR